MCVLGLDLDHHFRMFFCKCSRFKLYGKVLVVVEQCLMSYLAPQVAGKPSKRHF